MALCSGIAGLELGLHLVVPDYRAVCHVERDCFAASVLVARMEDEAMAAAPIWDDLATFDGEPWRGVVDCVTAGFPCQPWSGAGLAAGAEDERWLWPHIARIVRQVGPELVFLENVPPLIARGGLGLILGDLAEMGFDAEWGVFSAASVGAPHLRKRVFILAYANGGESEREGVNGVVVGASGSVAEEGERVQREWGGNAVVGGGADVADPYTVGWDGWSGDESASGGRQESADGGVDLADASGSGRQRGGVSGHVACGRAFPPGPDEFEDWAEYLRATPGVEPAVLRGSDRLAFRLDRVRACGNGVLPLCAAAAFIVLARRAGLCNDSQRWNDGARSAAD